MSDFHNSWYNYVQSHRRAPLNEGVSSNDPRNVEKDRAGRQRSHEDRVRERLLRELTEDEVDHIEDVLSNIDPDEMPFNNLFQGNMRLILPFNALDITRLVHG